MQTGTRWSGKANPRDLTKTRQQQLLRQKAAREAAATVDITEVQRRARERGYTDGYERGLSDGWNVCIAALVDEGILAPDEPGDDDGDTDEQVE